jgi:hypothetical protein
MMSRHRLAEPSLLTTLEGRPIWCIALTMLKAKIRRRS